MGSCINLMAVFILPFPSKNNTYWKCWGKNRERVSHCKDVFPHSFCLLGTDKKSGKSKLQLILKASPYFIFTLYFIPSLI